MDRMEWEVQIKGRREGMRIVTPLTLSSSSSSLLLFYDLSS